MRNRNFVQALKHSIDGIKTGFKTQRNLKIDLVAAIAAITLGLVLRLSGTEMLFIVFACAFVIVAEMINTAIEAVVDLVTEEYRELAKVAKDVAAGAVLIAAINALMVAIMIAIRFLKTMIK